MIPWILVTISRGSTIYHQHGKDTWYQEKYTYQFPGL